MTDDIAEIHIMGSKLSLLDGGQLLEAVAEMVGSDRKAVVIASGNVYSFNLAYEQEWLREFLNRAGIVRLESDGLRLGARILGFKTPRRVVFADFIWDLARFAEQRGFSIFLLGSRCGVADKAAARLQQRCPNLRIVGTHHGYFDKTRGSAETQEVIQTINAARPQLLFVGFGMPVQEKWLSENREHLGVNAVFTCGALFDFVSGELRRAPRWMTNHGLEWLGRFLIEPRRLWQRYLIGNTVFLWRVLKQRVGLVRFE